MWWRKQRERDLERELRAHLDLEAEERGDVYAARRALGNMAVIKEDVRRAWRWNSLADFARHLRQSLRALARRPSFALVAILSLAVAIGANTAVFSLARGIVLKTLPAPGADRFVLLRQHNTSFHLDNCCFSYPFFQQLRSTDTDFEDMLAVTSLETVFEASGQSEKLKAEMVSGNYFRMLDVRPALGRLLEDADEASNRFCVISYDMWQDRFGRSPDVLGQPVTLGGEPFQIVGVTQQGFSGAGLHSRADLQAPVWMVDKLIGRGSGAQIIGRLKPGVTRPRAESRLDAMGRQILHGLGFSVATHDDLFLQDGSQGILSQKEQYGKPVIVLFLLVAVVLLIACSNLAALLLVRSVERSREAGLRLAIGASRGAIARQFLTESLMLAVAGGALACALALGMQRVLLSMLDSAGAGVARQSRLDAAVFVFCAGVSLLAGLLFGLLPAWRASRVDPLAALRGSANGAGGHRSILAPALIAGQIALSLALLFGAGLFTQTLRHLRAIDLGFDPENLILISLDHQIHPQSSASFFREVLQRARALPGVRAASLTGHPPLINSMGAVTIQIPGLPPPSPGSYNTSALTGVSDGYLRTLGVPLIAGRDFNSDDRDDGPETPVIVDQEFARKFFGGDALGKTFTYAARRAARVIGVGQNAKYRLLREDPSPAMYLVMSQRFQPNLYLQVRASGDPSIMIQRLRSLVQSLDSSVAISSVSTMEMQIDQSLSRERMLAFLSTLLGAVSVALAAIGLYGVLAFSVSRRTREIGIRMAVGADRGGILAMVLRESMWMVAAGIAAGVPLALACGRFASAMLYGLKPQDALTAVAATLLLAAAAVVASLLPAWRAARVDPMTALRSE